MFSRHETLSKKTISTKSQSARFLEAMLRNELLSASNYNKASQICNQLLTTGISSNAANTEHHRQLDMCWNVGIHILSDKLALEATNDPMDDKAAKRLLERFMTKVTASPKSSTFLVESILYSLRVGQHKAAYERLESQISLHPYNEDALLLSYAGLLAFVIWKTDEESRLDSRFIKLAIGYYERSFDLNTDCDAAVASLCQLYTVRDMHDKIEPLLLRYYQSNPGLLAIKRLNAFYPRDSSTWFQFAWRIAIMDPTDDPNRALNPLIEHFTASNGK